MKEYKLIRWLLAFVSHVKGKVLLAVALGIISNLSVVAIPIIGVREVLEIVKGQAGEPLQALFLMVICGIVRGVTRYGEQYLNHDIAFRLLADIRQEIFATIRSLGPAKLLGKKSGDLVAAITTDVEALEVFFAHTISPVLIAIGTTVITVGYLWQDNSVLALILLLGQLLVGIVIPIVGYRNSQALGDEYQTAFVALNQNVMENAASLQDITQYSIEAKQLKKLDEAGNRLNVQYKRRLAQESTLRILSEIVLLATAVCILVVGMQLDLSASTVLTGTVLSLSSFGSVLALSGLGSALLTTLASGRRLFGLTMEQPDVDFSTSQKELSNFEKTHVDNVSFSYSAEKEAVLSELSLSIEKGAVIGIGGQSGNGKSTLVKLLMRYWDPQSGQIRFNQTNIKTIQENSLHQIEGVIEQATFIFDDTVANNIGLGKKQATQAEIEISAKQASLHEWIMSLPEQYETKIGGNNRSISDGERQRVGLARLFLHDAPFLLLDEPTSNLDYLNEQAILQTLTKEIEEKTVLVISHRDTTLEITDQRYELSDGKLCKL
ncbi:hypothetical protein A5881_002430 [Enterococcus termitis]|nr:hypothetical protein A5881_001249 [Enterococcus termitis]